MCSTNDLNILAYLYQRLIRMTVSLKSCLQYFSSGGGKLSKSLKRCMQVL